MNKGEHMNKLAKIENTKALTNHIPAGQKPITVKHVMLLDTGDGAFTDDSVKTKPFKGDDRKLMLKCVDAKRLLSALQRLGLPAASPVIRGGKHFMVAVWKKDFASALTAQQHAQLGFSGSKLLGK